MSAAVLVLAAVRVPIWLAAVLIVGGLVVGFCRWLGERNVDRPESSTDHTSDSDFWAK
jgi:hypothetical protein